MDEQATVKQYATDLSIWRLTDSSFDHEQLIQINPLSNDKILDWSTLKAFAANKIKVLRIMIFVFDRIENIVGKGENAGNQHFLLFPQCFQKLFNLGLLKVRIVW